MSQRRRKSHTSDQETGISDAFEREAGLALRSEEGRGSRHGRIQRRQTIEGSASIRAQDIDRALVDIISAVDNAILTNVHEIHNLRT
jgi:hypothetical protein